jgi:hypothetical protein
MVIEEPRSAARPRLGFTVGWLVLLTLAELLCVLSDPQSAHPRMVAPYAFVLGTILAAWLSAAIHLGWVLLRKRHMHYFVRITKIVLCAGAGLVASALVMDAVLGREMADVERRLEPLVERLESGSPEWREQVPEPEPDGLRVWRDELEFVIAVEAGSGDLEGTTLVYDSEEPGWRRRVDGLTPAETAHERHLPLVHPRPRESAP